jgi:hypothetical protein
MLNSAEKVQERELYTLQISRKQNNQKKNKLKKQISNLKILHVFKPCMTTPRKPFYFTMKFTAT